MTVLTATILGCGSSTGVPRLGGPDGAGDWGACDPKNPKNRRRRCSLLLQRGGTTVLIDTSPDLREQLLTLSDLEQTYSYCLLETPVPLFN